MLNVDEILGRWYMTEGQKTPVTATANQLITLSFQSGETFYRVKVKGNEEWSEHFHFDGRFLVIQEKSAQTFRVSRGKNGSIELEAKTKYFRLWRSFCGAEPQKPTKLTPTQLAQFSIKDVEIRDARAPMAPIEVCWQDPESRGSLYLGSLSLVPFSQKGALAYVKPQVSNLRIDLWIDMLEQAIIPHIIEDANANIDLKSAIEKGYLDEITDFEIIMA